MKRINTDNLELSKVQDYVAEALFPLEKCFLFNGVLVSNVSITAGTVSAVHHKLGRTPIGYLIINQNADARIWRSDSTLPAIILNLNASNNVGCSLWIF